ncbi:hypothetical protein OEZ85_007142 [Tetradesmus obliquus]|uniref:tRNA-splicing endonuclease subunit Sen54 N-terminal domain-containing protein n=1 Tax=Tetradesmus obliquus TaxID=3088 RepID=A0ABY8TWR5_TETOB|nr:hypothetical protein OEZ85_007142 [Tetradesmus obliquus]
MTDRSDVKLAAIFRRGGQKEELLGDGPSSDKQELNQQLQQLAVAWATPKARRGLAAAVWRPLLGAFEVTVRGRQQFNGQGFMHNKKLYLNIEEAVFMMDQAELMLLVEQQEGQQQRLLSMQEALHMMVSLGVSLDRLQLLSHLNRIGYHVRRHPACWLAPAEQPPAATWQCSPAWSTTDGLPPPASAAATATAWHARSVGVVEQGLAADARHQQQLLQQPEQQKTKRRKVAATELGAAEEAAAEVVQQQLPLMPGWWDKVPAWLAGAQQALAGSGASAADASSMQQQAACGLGQCHDELLGVQLRQQYPELLPLPTYPGQQQQQQQQHEEAHKQQQGQLQQELHAGPHSSTGGDAEMVFDAIACQAGFSYSAIALSNNTTYANASSGDSVQDLA